MESSRKRATRGGSAAWWLDTTSPQQTILLQKVTEDSERLVLKLIKETGCENVVSIWLCVRANAGLL
jgi:hypothetical protein